MTDAEQAELARLRAALDDIERRVQDTMDNLYRVHEGMRDAKIALTLLREHQTSAETQKETPTFIATHGYLA